MKKIMVSHSIPGSRVVITATKEVSDRIFKKLIQSNIDGFGILEGTFTLGKQTKKSETDGVTLLSWSLLLNRDNKPLRSPPLIKSRFNLLRDAGWTVDDKAFIKKYWTGAKTKKAA